MNFPKKYNWKQKKSTSVHESKKERTYASLLNEDQKQSASIQDLSFDFACRIIRLFQYLTEDTPYKEYIISKQVFRSGTSIGANIREAFYAHSNQYRSVIPSDKHKIPFAFRRAGFSCVLGFC